MYQKVGTDIPLIKEDSVLKNVKRYLHIWSCWRTGYPTHRNNPGKKSWILCFKCKCRVVMCSDFDGCNGCNFKDHSFSKWKEKIPKDHLHFIFDQRSRSGERGSYLIGQLDRTARTAADLASKLNRGTRLPLQVLQSPDPVSALPFSSDSEEEPQAQSELEEPTSS